MLASFERTNQTAFLDADAQDLPGILSGLHSVCAVASALLGNVSASDGETTMAGNSVGSSAATAAATGNTSLSAAGLLLGVEPYTLFAGLGLVVGATVLF
jgi:hypothetical protein